jgi:hypothetical protein
VTNFWGHSAIGGMKPFLWQWNHFRGHRSLWVSSPSLRPVLSYAGVRFLGGCVLAVREDTWMYQLVQKMLPRHRSKPRAIQSRIAIHRVLRSTAPSTRTYPRPTSSPLHIPAHRRALNGRCAFRRVHCILVGNAESLKVLQGPKCSLLSVALSSDNSRSHLRAARGQSASSHIRRPEEEVEKPFYPAV